MIKIRHVGLVTKNLKAHLIFGVNSSVLKLIEI